MKVLIIDHGSEFKDSLAEKFKAAEYISEFSSGFHDASEKLALYEYDCTLIVYPSVDKELMKFLQSHEQDNHIGGLIMLSSGTSVEHKVQLLDMGADDFVNIPVHFSELDARIKAVVRRRKFQSGHKIYFANLVIEFNLRKVLAWNTPIELTRKEYEILLYLISNRDKVVSRVALAEYLWGEDTGDMESFNILSAHIKNIRRKMKNAKAEVEIRNSYGVGYQIIEL